MFVQKKLIRSFVELKKAVIALYQGALTLEKAKEKVVDIYKSTIADAKLGEFPTNQRDYYLKHLEDILIAVEKHQFTIKEVHREILEEIVRLWWLAVKTHTISHLRIQYVNLLAQVENLHQCQLAA